MSCRREKKNRRAKSARKLKEKRGDKVEEDEVDIGREKKNKKNVDTPKKMSIMPSRCRETATSPKQ